MQTHWLHTNKASDKLIIFFAGFASHYSHYLHLDSNVNVLLCYDYKDFSFDINVSKYCQVFLVAYSMGVSVAARLLQNMQNKISFTRKIALSGTNLGIDKTLGIHPTLFIHTIKKFNLTDFKNAIFGKNIDKAKDFYFAEQTHLKQELQYLYDFCKSPLHANLTWDRIYISTKDTLFSPQVCYMAFGRDNKAIFELPTWHYPFFMFKTWEELCNID